MRKFSFAAIAAGMLVASSMLAHADERNAGAAAGAATGAVTGAIVGGPVGAAVGGAIGGTVGAGPSEPSREVIIEDRRPPVTEKRCVEDADSKRCVEVTR